MELKMLPYDFTVCKLADFRKAEAFGRAMALLADAGYTVS